METSFWSRLVGIIKESYKKYLTAHISGLGLGIGIFHPFYFADVPAALMHNWLPVWLWIKTIGSAYVASWCTAAGADHYARYKLKKEAKKKRNKR